jgi:G:T-mismatch repair DNA endonuclease (very short patch repair protein)
MGYRVVVIWECQTKASARSSLTNRLTRMLGRVGLSTRGQTVRASS